MKNVLTTCILAFLGLIMAMPSQAQMARLGVKGGLNMSSLKHIDSFDTVDKNSTGFFIGPMLEVGGILGLGADAAVMYSQRGKGDYKQNGVQVPVNLKYSFGSGSLLAVYLAAGPDFYFNFKDIDNAKLKEQYDQKKCQVGVNLGGGIKLLGNLQLGVVYTVPVGDSFTVKKASDKAAQAIRDKAYNNWQVSIAYLF